MPTGIAIRGTHGYLQIDGDLPNYCLVQTGTAAMSGSRSTLITSNAPMVAPLMAIRSHTRPIAIVRNLGTSGGSWEWVCYTADDSNPSFNYYIYDRTPPVDPGYGVLIKNAAGEVVFAIGKKYMRAVTGPITLDFDSTAGFGTSPSPVWTSGAFGRQYAALQVRHGFHSFGGGMTTFGDPEPLGFQYVTVGVFRQEVDYGIWAQKFEPINGLVTDTARNIKRNPSYVILDVTGHDTL